MALILWRDAQGHEGRLDLEAGEAKIGRGMDCAIRTDDAMVSRNHARLYWDGGQCFVEDLGSANGVFYQEQRVTRHAMKHGDAVRCGSLWLRFVDHQAPQHRASAPVPAQAAPPQAAPPMQARPATAPAPVGQPMAPQAAPAAPAPRAPSAPVAAPPGPGADEEIRRLRRRIDQLTAELRIYRGGGKGVQIEDLEGEIDSIKAENAQLKEQVQQLEHQIATEGGDVKVQKAGQVQRKATEVVSALNDLLSNLRINVTAAEGEFDQYAGSIPRASFELIREAMRSAAGDLEQARELLRELRRLAG